MNTRENPRATPGLISGVVIIVVGVVLLLDRLEVMDAWMILRFWPSALVLIGVAKLVWGRDGSARLWGGILAATGVLIQLHILGYVYLRWGVLWPLILIAVGVAVLWGAITGRRYQRWCGCCQSATCEHIEAGGPRLREWTVFGGVERRVETKDFRGGDLAAIFGGCEVDLSEAEIQGEEAVIAVTSIFSGITLRIPEHWTLASRVAPVFGSFEDKTRPRRPDQPAGKQLTITGSAIFGSVEVKN